MKRTVGVLALQGGFASHIAALEGLSAPDRPILPREVRTARDLEACDALIIPGGESTVLTKHLMKGGTGPAYGLPWEPNPLWDALRDFADPAGTRAKPVMGTCAGLIILAGPCGDERVYPLSLLPVRVERNAYGRQTESFIGHIPLAPEFLRAAPGPAEYRAVFIRAPRIADFDEGVHVLAWLETGEHREPVMVRYKNLLGLTFHPELAPEDPRIHAYFLGMLGDGQ